MYAKSNMTQARWNAMNHILHEGTRPPGASHVILALCRLDWIDITDKGYSLTDAGLVEFDRATKKD